MGVRDKIAKALADLIANPAKVIRGAEPSSPDYVYHATNAERLQDIVGAGKLKTHRPNEFTDQSMWPDMSIEKRNYFTPTAENTWQFAPEEGAAALLRMKTGTHPVLPERGTGDLYSTKPVPAKNLEYLGADETWRRLMMLGLVAPPAAATFDDRFGALAAPDRYEVRP